MPTTLINIALCGLEEEQRARLVEVDHFCPGSGWFCLHTRNNQAEWFASVNMVVDDHNLRSL